MSLREAFDADINLIEDGRASRRDIGKPQEIRVESSQRLGDRASQIDAALASDVIPIVFVDAHGNVWLLTAGGSGVVAYESDSDQPTSDHQAEIIDRVVANLRKWFGIKTKKAKQTDPDVLVGVVEPEFPTDWPDTISDVSLEANE